ncbi:MAG: domain 2 [Chthoniobacter sp.]|jgi:hypothetical protein|nr:domain 2 [Chthoniobacter sp.]
MIIEWYYRDSKSQKVGPLSSEDFEEKVFAGEIKGTTRVWRSGLQDWTTYAALLGEDSGEESSPVSSAGTELTEGHSPASFAAEEAASQTTHHESTSAPDAAQEVIFETCAECHEKMPGYLFATFGKRRVCGVCGRKLRLKAQTEKWAEAKGVDSNWLVKHILRVAICALILAAIRIVVLEMGTHGAQPSDSLPVPEQFPSSVAASGPGR